MEDKKYHLVTSFSTRLWNKYASNTIGTFIEQFKPEFPSRIEDFTLWLDAESEIQDFSEINGIADCITNDKFRFAALNTLGEYISFERRFGGDIPLKERGMELEKIPEGSQFRFKYLPFAKKVFSWAATFMTMPENEYLVWIDADVSLKHPMSSEYLDVVIGDFDIAFLDRDFPWYAAETGFFIIKRTPDTERFVQLILHIYVSGFLFDMSEWHDGYVFKTALKLVMSPNMKVLNLNPTPRERDVFERSILADVMEHLKGVRKNNVAEEQLLNDEPPTLINFDPENQ